MPIYASGSAGCGLLWPGGWAFLYYAIIVLGWTGPSVLVSAVSRRSLRVMSVVLRNLSVAFATIGFIGIIRYHWQRSIEDL